MHWNEKQPYVHVEQNHAPQKGTSSSASTTSEEQGQPRAFTPPLGTQLPRRPLLRALCILFLRH